MTDKARHASSSLSVLAMMAAVTIPGCPALGRREPAATIRYVGSSTVANFLRDAEEVYGEARFAIDDEPESAGGEEAILEGHTELAGVARRPDPAVLSRDVRATEIGRDAIAVIVNELNPVVDLSLTRLQAIFTGKARNWREVGGPDLPVKPFIVGVESATRKIFRGAVLGEDEYGGCEVIRPDRAIVDAVAAEAGAVGQISFSFLSGDGAAPGVRAVAVDGEEPSVTNFDYPISRPLFLLWRSRSPEVESFVRWAASTEGQRVVMKRFVGARTLGRVEPAPKPARSGALIVYTETYPVYDGGIYYYPHRPYEIYTRDGEPVRRVPNHRGQNDETPMKVDLPGGTYLIRAESSRGRTHDVLVTIVPGRTTEVFLEELLKGRK